MIHHTKDKGDIGVGAVIADLLIKGIKPFIPLSEHMPYDLIGAYPDGTLKRISVKYREAKDGKVTVLFQSTYSDSKGVHITDWDKNAVDLVAIFCPDTRGVYYIDPQNFASQVVLRLTKPKNNQSKGINMAEDFMVP